MAAHSVGTFIGTNSVSPERQQYKERVNVLEDWGLENVLTFVDRSPALGREAAGTRIH